MKEVKILGNFDLGYYVYQLGIAMPLFSVKYNNYQNTFTCYEINGKYFGQYSSLDNLLGNLEIYFNH
tara:strand:+ start:253 stop:453 length:201 start_codon:yes stop_codon:yes gene_type:complete